MKAEWYILIHKKREGPYSVEQLKHDLRFTPDTLVWKVGFPKWVPAGQVYELRKAFKDDHHQEEEKEEENKIRQTHSVLEARLNPSYFWWWILILILILIYSFFKLYYSR